jgi:cytochrome c peroxidase
MRPRECRMDLRHASRVPSPWGSRSLSRIFELALARAGSRLGAAISALALVAGCEGVAPPPPQPVPTPLDPDDLIVPIPVVPFDAPRALLGERLFEDARLSVDGTVRCTSCHDLVNHGGADGLAHSQLPTRDPGPINVPTVFNVGLNFRWSWTGRWTFISDQIDAAMHAPHAMRAGFDDAVPLLAPTYAADFADVYPDGLTAHNVRDALSQYLLSLTTPTSRFDSFLLDPEAAPLSDSESQGWALFCDIGCVSCHQGVNIGGNLVQRFGVVTAPDDCVATPADDGLYTVTHREADRHLFRVPSLRNVALTAPYFHNACRDTLEGAVQLMARIQLGRELRPDQVDLLVAFLRTLTGVPPARRIP